jgi:hypothetical protein
MEKNSLSVGERGASTAWIGHSTQTRRGDADCLNAIGLGANNAGHGKPRHPSAALKIAGSALMGFPILA